MRALLVQGVDARTADPNGRDALYYATMAGQANVVQELLRHGLSAETKLYDGWSAFDLALKENKAAVVAVMLDYIMRPSAALPGACAWGKPEVVARLLQSGADPNSSGEDGEHCLSLAAGRGAYAALDLWRRVDHQLQDDEAEAIVSQILAAGAKLGQPGDTSLEAACRAGNERTALLLLKVGADSHRPTVNGDHLLLLAAADGRVELVRALLQAGADLSARDSHGLSARQCLDGRIQDLELSRAQLSRIRSYQPREAYARDELARLAKVYEAILALVDPDGPLTK